jgi:acid phosphatase
MGDPAFQLPEEDQPDIRPNLQVLEGGGESTPRKKDHLSSATDNSDHPTTETKDKTTHGGGAAMSDTLGKGFTGGVAAATGSGAAVGFAKRAGQFFWGSKRRKQATASSGIVTVLVAAVSVGSIWFAGPFEAIHVAQILLKGHFQVGEDQGDERTGRLYRYLRSGGDIGETRLGYLSSKYKTAMLGDLEKIGLKPIKGGANTFKGFEIDRAAKGNPYSDLSNKETLNRLAEKGIKPSSVKFNGSKAEISMKGYFQNRAATKLLVKDMGYKGVNTALRSRILRSYYGLTWHPLKRIDMKVNEKIADAYKTWKEEREKRISNGVDESGKANIGSKDEAKSKLEAIKSSKSVKIAGGIAAAQAVVCGLHAVAAGIDDIRYTDVVLPLMRLSGEAISTGQQTQSNQDIDATALSFVAKNFSGVDPDTGKKTTWNQAESIQHQAGKTNSGIEAPQADQGIAEGVPSWLLWTNAQPVKKACSDVGQWIGTGVSTAVGVLSGGIVSTIVGGVTSMIAVPKAIEAASGFLSGEAVDPNAGGAAWGSNIDYGGALLANGQALQFAGGALSKTEVAQLQSQVEQADAQDFAAKSFAYRLLNPRDHRTLAAKMIDGSSSVQPQNIASTFASTLTNLGSIFKAPFSLLFGKAHAATGPFDYGFPIYGFSDADMKNPMVADPYANAEKVAKILDGASGSKYIDQANDCFSISINKDENDKWAAVPDTSSHPDGINIYAQKYSPSKCRDGGSLNHSNWLRVRFFIFDSGIMDGYACYQGDETSCQNDGVTTNTGGVSSTGSGSSFRIATFNVLGASHTPGTFQARAAKTIQVIKSNQIDIVGLQEFQVKQRAYIYPQIKDTYDIFPAMGSDNQSHSVENSIIWNRNKFEQVGEGKFQPDLLYFCESLKAPYVRLRDKSTGQEFYVLNTHDPANSQNNACANEAAKRRWLNAQQHVNLIKQLEAQGVPVFYTGDFNSRYTLKTSGNGSPYQGKAENLTYCIMAVRGPSNDAYDAFKKRPVTCPNKTPPGSGGGIDHVYLSKGLSVTNYIAVASHDNGSDHPTLIFDVTIPGSGSGANFSLATWNLPAGRKPGYTSAQQQWQLATQSIQKNNVDIIGFQEIGRGNFNYLKSNLAGYGSYPASFPAREARLCSVSESIFYNESQFKFVKGDYVTYPRYPWPAANCGNNGETAKRGLANAPIVWLQDKSTGQQIIVMNIHNEANVPAAGNTSPALNRYQSNQIFVRKIQELKQGNPGIPVFLTGDFNEGTDVRTSGNVTYQGKQENLIFCMFAANHLMKSADGPAMKCDPQYSIGGVDYVYVPPDISVDSIKHITRKDNGSDHAYALVANITIPGANTTTKTSKKITKVLTIIEENHSLDQMKSNMPYAFSLAQKYGYANNYTAIRHPSLPNYIAIAGGSTMGVGDDRLPSVHPLKGQSVFGQALANKKTAKLYAESMASNCVVNADSGNYRTKHNPWAYFIDERTLCRQYDVPFSRFAGDVTAGNLPNVGMVIPNMCNDAHNCSLGVADNWLKSLMAKIFAGPDWNSGRLAVVLTADEDDNASGNRVLTVVMHPELRSKVVSTGLTHYSLSRLYSEVAGGHGLRAAGTATSLSESFGLSL